MRAQRLKKERTCEFPDGPVVKIPPSNAGSVGSIPGQGAKISHAMQTNKETE